MENEENQKKHLEETKKLLNSMKDVRAVEVIDQELSALDKSEERNSLIEEQNALEESIEEIIKTDGDTTELREKQNEISNKIAETIEFEMANKEKVETLKKEKEETEKKNEEIANHKKALIEKKEKLEHDIVEAKAKKNDIAMEGLKILQILNRAKENNLTQAEIDQKNAELKDIRVEFDKAINAEEVLKGELQDVEASLEEIERFEKDPKAYFEKETEKKQEEDEREDNEEEAARENDENNNRPRNTNNRPRNNNARDNGNGEIQDDNGQPANDRPVAARRPRNRAQGGNDQPSNNPTNTRGDGDNPTNTTRGSGDNLFVNVANNNPATYGEPSSVSHIEYDYTTNRYTFFNENGQPFKTSYKDMFIFRLLEERRIYKIYREQGLSRREAIEAISHLDPNITKQLSLMQDNEALERYLDYVNGEDNGFVNYKLATFGLIDARIKYAVRKRDELIRALPEGQGEPTQGQAEPVQGQAEPVQGQAEPVQGQAEPVQGQAEPVQGQTEPVQGQAEPVQGQAEPVQGQAEPVQGQGEPVQGQAEPVQGQGEPTQGQAEPVQGQGEPTQGQAEPVQSEPAQYKDNSFDLGEFGNLEVVELPEDEVIEVVNLDEDGTDSAPADSTTTDSKPANKRDKFLKTLDPNNRDIYSSPKAERQAEKARKAAEKARRKESKKAIKNELKNKGKSDDEGRG